MRTMSQIGYHPLNFREEAKTTRRRSASTRATRFRMLGNKNQTKKIHWENYQTRYPDHANISLKGFPHVLLRKVPGGWELSVLHDPSHPMTGSIMVFKTKREALAVADMYKREFGRPLSVKTNTGTLTTHYMYNQSRRRG